jgi:capsular exopolysaccharide synthesis family protein
LLDDLDIGQPEGTEILDISYRHENADVARARAAGFADAYLRYRRDAVARQFTESADVLAAQIQDLEADLRATERRLAGLADDDPERGVLEIEAQLLFNNILERELALAEFPEEVTVGQVIQPASPPLAPVSPNHVVNAILGMVLGLGAGVGVALVRERLSPRIHSTEEAEDYLRAPMLGAIPTVPQWRGRKKPFLVARTHWDSPATEAYRILRTSVLSAAEADGSKSIVVTSPHSREGKTATVANLGVVLARAGKRVVLVSADLRRPRLHEFFRRESDAGLSDVLAGRVPLEQVLQKVTFASSAGDRTSVSLWMLPSGRVPENPAELLTSQTMKQVLSKLEDSADIVLIDVPPILPVSDALSVASVAGSVLVVISPKSANRSAIVSARQQLDKVGARIMGGVLNGPDPSSIETYAY